jgi:hypothetical protein
MYACSPQAPVVRRRFLTGWYVVAKYIIYFVTGFLTVMNGGAAMLALWN